MNLHPQIIEKEGRKEFVILPYEEFMRLKEILEDYEDLRDLRNAKAESAAEEAIPLKEAMRIISEDPEAYPQNKPGVGNGE